MRIVTDKPERKTMLIEQQYKTRSVSPFPMLDHSNENYCAALCFKAICYATGHGGSNF